MGAPRRSALRRDSRTTKPAPSPSSMPSRPAANGVQRSLAMARMREKPMKARRENASVPPASRRVAWAPAIRSEARQIATLPAEQEVATVRVVPRTPSDLAIRPPRLERKLSATAPSSAPPRPSCDSTAGRSPIVVPTHNPSTSSAPSREDARASSAAIRASRLARGSPRPAAPSRPSSSAPGISQPTWLRIPVTSKETTRAAASRPAWMAAQKSATPTPIGETTPQPVTTTSAPSVMVVDIDQHFPDGLHGRQLLLGDLEAEILLDQRDELEPHHGGHAKVGEGVCQSDRGGIDLKQEREALAKCRCQVVSAHRYTSPCGSQATSCRLRSIAV